MLADQAAPIWQAAQVMKALGSSKFARAPQTEIKKSINF
jgi:hypothetical protein